MRGSHRFLGYGMKLGQSVELYLLKRNEEVSPGGLCLPVIMLHRHPFRAGVADSRQDSGAKKRRRRVLDLIMQVTCHPEHWGSGYVHDKTRLWSAPVHPRAGV